MDDRFEETLEHTDNDYIDVSALIHHDKPWTVWLAAGVLIATTVTRRMYRVLVAGVESALSDVKSIRLELHAIVLRLAALEKGAQDADSDKP